MDKNRLKAIIGQLEVLLETLKSEVYSDVNMYSQEDTNQYSITDYDEVFFFFFVYDMMSAYHSKNPYTLINDDDGDGI